MKHVIEIRLANRSGELARVVNLISGRGFNIERLLVEPTKDKPEISCAEIALEGDETKVKLLVTQIARQVRVIEAKLRILEENKTGL